MALPLLGQAAGALNFVTGGILRAYDPKKDAERQAEARRLYDAALSGDRQSELRLRCLSGDKSLNATFGGDCGYASDPARALAKSLILELDARRAGAALADDVAGAAGTIERGATYLGAKLDPSRGGPGTLLTIGLILVGGVLLWRTVKG